MAEKKSRDLLSEAREYFPIGVTVRCLASSSEFVVLNKNHFYSLDDNAVCYAVGSQWAGGANAFVYWCGSFANFYQLQEVNEPLAMYNWKDFVDEKHPKQTGFFREMEFDENDIQAAVDNILEFPTLPQQNAFWLVVKERLINNRITEMEELNENVNKERERIQLLKNSLEELS